jgi:hypothetical protein
MTRIALLLSGAIALAGLSACSTNTRPVTAAPLYPVQEVVQENVSVGETTNIAVRELVANSNRNLDQRGLPGLLKNQPIIVTTLADVNDFHTSSTLGRIVSEQVVAELANEGYFVPEVHLRPNLFFSGEGEFMLSREMKKLLTTDQKGQAFITGSYAVGSREIMVILRAVSLDDFRTIASASYTLPIGPNTRSLLSAKAT